MKTELLLWTGVALMAAVVISSLAMAGEADDWTTPSPLAFGEPMEDCDQHHPALVAKEDLVPMILPVVVPVQDVEPVKPAVGKTTQKPLSPGALFTFALIASPGSQIPVTAK